jgi:hypothetical protein
MIIAHQEACSAEKDLHKPSDFLAFSVEMSSSDSIIFKSLGTPN